MNRIPCVGEIAPDFKAAAFHGGRQVETCLSRYRGQWVVLIFYPGDFTCVCPTEIAAAAVKYPAFRELGAELLAVSTDTVEAHRDFQEKELARVVSGGALFPLVSDPSGAVGSLAELARLMRVTRARITQIMILNHLAPEIQEALLFLPRTVSGRAVLTERDLRAVAAEVDWGRQREMVRHDGVSILT